MHQSGKNKVHLTNDEGCNEMLEVVSSLAAIAKERGSEVARSKGRRMVVQLDVKCYSRPCDPSNSHNQGLEYLS